MVPTLLYPPLSYTGGHLLVWPTTLPTNMETPADYVHYATTGYSHWNECGPELQILGHKPPS